MQNKNTGRIWHEELKSSSHYFEFLKEPVVYFCAEYALWNDAPFYAGGLGVLAGDCIQEMADDGLPVVALGLYYHKKNASQKRASYDENYGDADPKSFGLELVSDSSKEPVQVTVLIDDREVYLQAWKWQRGNTTLFLLDTKLGENSSVDQTISDTLYVEDREMRLKQEIILGIGGMKLLRAMGIHPSVYHLNEGHSAFLAFELIRHEIKHHEISFAKAIEYARKHIVFTNHTLVAAGHELFATDVVRRMLKAFALGFAVNIDDLISLGLEKETGLFSMTVLALNLSSKVNAVSVLHGKKAGELWHQPHVYTVTNGVYIKRWDALKESDPKKIWQKHQENKIKLLELIKNKSGQVFDKEVLLLGWARRFVPYKRPLALFGNILEFKRLSSEAHKKIQVVYSGPVSESDQDKNEFVRELMRLIKSELNDTVVFLPNYDLELARLLVAGCDIWLNTPIVGSEACGTSGMKACLNGVLPLATADGWMYEVPLPKIGWELSDKNISSDILRVLEEKIMPMYYNNIEKQGDMTEWTSRMQIARQLILDEFSTSRVLKEYVEKFYIPALENKRHPL